jgi:hypothetical protein
MKNKSYQYFFLATYGFRCKNKSKIKSHQKTYPLDSGSGQKFIPDPDSGGKKAPVHFNKISCHLTMYRCSICSVCAQHTGTVQYK